MRQALAAAATAAIVVVYAVRSDARVPQAEQAITRSVSGSAVHHFTTAMIHSETPTATGKVQRSTDIVDLSGDLKGRVLYHPTTVIHLSNRLAGPKVGCDLVVAGTGAKTPEGDGIVEYRGTCTFKR